MTPSTGARVHALLAADPAVAALARDRIYPVEAKQGAQAPRIVFLLVDDPDDTMVDGTSSGLVNARLQVNCFANNYEQAQALAEAVKKMFQAQSGPALSAVPRGKRDLPTGDPLVRCTSRDFSLWIQET